MPQSTSFVVEEMQQVLILGHDGVRIYVMWLRSYRVWPPHHHSPCPPSREPVNQPDAMPQRQSFFLGGFRRRRPQCGVARPLPLPPLTARILSVLVLPALSWMRDVVVLVIVMIQSCCWCYYCHDPMMLLLLLLSWSKLADVTTVMIQCCCCCYYCHDPMLLLLLLLSSSNVVVYVLRIPGKPNSCVTCIESGNLK